MHIHQEQTISLLFEWFKTKNLVGFGSKFLLLWISRLDGFIIFIKNSLTRFVFFLWFSCSDIIFRPSFGNEARCRAHRNDPGWFVGEHRHIRGLEVDEIKDGCLRDESIGFAFLCVCMWFDLFRGVIEGLVVTQCEILAP